MGNLATNELADLYNASDAFISLSVHNDEDYGMSPAEALNTGLPCILTEWGGYRSFKNKSTDNQCILIKTSILPTHISYDRAALLKSFFIMIKNEKINRERRFDLQKINSQYLSIESNEKVISKILTSPISLFTGFSPLIKELAKTFTQAPPFVSQEVKTEIDPETYEYISKTKSTYNSTYKKIYESYVSK